MSILLSSNYSHCLLRHASILLNIDLHVSHWIYFRSGQNKGGGWAFWVLSNLNSKQEILIYVFCKKQTQNILLESNTNSNTNNVRTRASEKPWIRSMTVVLSPGRLLTSPMKLEKIHVLGPSSWPPGSASSGVDQRHDDMYTFRKALQLVMPSLVVQQ